MKIKMPINAISPMAKKPKTMEPKQNAFKKSLMKFKKKVT